MVFLFYNKWLLRLLVLLSGLGIALCAWRYIALSVEKLPEQGLRDALAIVSFLIAGWLVMLLAEVVDNHYARAFGCLCAMLGGYASYKWIFLVDGPKLRELPDGSLMGQVGTAFWGAMLASLTMLALLVTRLILDKANAGRLPAATYKAAAPIGGMLGAAGSAGSGGATATVAPAPSSALPPIPVDLSPLAVSSGAAPAAAPAAPARNPAPVSRIEGIGGVYLGSSFALSPGEHSIGRADADILLASDNQVSRRHASISVGPDGIATLADQGSTNGTFLNDQRVVSIQLVPGDVLRIGTTLFRVEA